MQTAPQGAENMYGGSITGNTANVGGGVYMYGGQFTMYGGSITGNTAKKSNNNDGNGGGVYVNGGGTFTMTGGEISGGNTAEKGGGVCVYSGTFNMSGGSIVGANAGDANTATYGGGVYVGDNGTFAMSGSARIIKNEATEIGGGEYVGG